MIPEEAWSLVPKEKPPGTTDSQLVAAERAQLDARQTQAYLWALYLLATLRRTPLRVSYPGVYLNLASPPVIDISAGFIPFFKESPLMNSPWITGASLVTKGDQNFSFGLVIGIDENTPWVVPFDILVRDFPIIVVQRRIKYHAPPHPASVSSACYVRPGITSSGAMWSNGILIARHVLSSVGFAIGASVPMATGRTLSVADLDGNTNIDAAILDCGTLPSSASSLKLSGAHAPGTRVTVRTANHGSFSADILRICDDPKYFGNMISHRVFIDHAGVSGDSGSLVSTQSTNEAIGIYIGETGASPNEGIVQSMRQVVKYFDIDLYD
jgi:hypothetical protein